MARLSIQERGFDDVLSRTADLGRTGINEDEIAQTIGAVLFNRIRTRFLSEVDTDGSPWPKSAAASREGRKTLFKTGNLFFSLQLAKNADGEYSIGTPVEYSVFHNEGTGGQEKREFLAFSAEDERLAVRVAEANIDRMING